MGGPRKLRQGVLETFLFGGGGGGHQRFFTDGRMDLPRGAIGPNGSNCFSRGIHTTCDFPGGPLPPFGSVSIASRRNMLSQQQ